MHWSFLVPAVLLGTTTPDIQANQSKSGSQDPVKAVAKAAPDKEDGFVTLFDGKSLAGWKAYRREELPEAWKIEDGLLTFVPGSGRGGDLRTEEMYKDFDLRLEWKISKGGNSGVMYRVQEKYVVAYATGPEYQILDNDEHPDGKNPKTSAGANYALHDTLMDAVRPVGEWNESRIVIKDNSVQHYLNGKKTADYVLLSPEWEELVKASKFARAKDYGRMPEGFIVLQDHGNRVWFRNIRIKRL